ncbi:MAG: hypothetical protein IKC50_05790 [Oscillospiraceae bacterium]|nr:hypothetical protein [Oscillospiraceae bacterium]MBR2366580.1 hypothetical protein [Oscillospiraceae bacterium]MBR2977768.1 hypothetical protein [Oscillospiraceae bacterium]
MNDYYCTSGGQGRPPAPPMPAPPRQVESVQQTPEACACRASMVQALQMLLRSGLSSLIDFQSFAFVTEDYVVGANLVRPDTTAAVYDNLSDTLAAAFTGFTACNCNYVDAAGSVFAPTQATTAETCLLGLFEAITANADTTTSADLAALIAGLTVLQEQITPGSATLNAALVTALDGALACFVDTGLLASRVSLCALTAVVFEPVGDTEVLQTQNYQAAKALMQNIIRPRCESSCPPYPDPCCDPCNCSDTNICPGRAVALNAGPLSVSGVTVLGNIGQVLVLTNDTENRFYFVCVDKADFLR